MSTDIKAMEWTEVRGKIKQKWNKFMDADIDGFKGNMDLIAEKLQKSYGYTKDKAEQEFADFKKTLEPAVAAPEKSKPN